MFYFQAISQIVFDPDIIEISGGLYYKLSSRSLTSCPYKPTDKGRISPRIFKEVPDKVDKTGGVFADAVKNSFPDIKEQMEFIVKFYQCLLAFQLPQKTTKLALVGPKNSGKTSFVNVVRGLTHPEFIASLSKEKIFGMSMINSDTQFIFIDELSSEIMAGDQAKILLQGGPITVPRKHEEPEIVDNQAGEPRKLFSRKALCAVNSDSSSTYFAFNASDFLFVKRLVLSVLRNFRHMQRETKLWR